MNTSTHTISHLGRALFFAVPFVLFELTRGENRWLQVAGVVILNWMGSPVFGVPLQLYAVLALIPIYLYKGRKATNSKWVQWGFYLFYPVHLLVLSWI